MAKKASSAKATRTKRPRKRTPKVATRFVTSENIEAMLIASATQARQIAKGERPPTRMYTASARTIRVAEPRPYRRDDVMRVRQKLGVSQQVFANLLGRSGAAVRAWELPNSGKAPDGAAARLLEIFERYPEIAEELMEPRGRSRRPA
jgi:DNA-binding transcriptional regulator YiaG